MPLITKKQAEARLKPYLPTFARLLRQRDMKTGRVRVPWGELQAVQEMSGDKFGRGAAIRFYDWQVEALVAALEAREAALRAAQPRPQANPLGLLALADEIERKGGLRAARSLRREAQKQMAQQVI